MSTHSLDRRQAAVVRLAETLPQAPVVRAPGIAGIEKLPKFILCIPMVLQWFWLGLRYRSLTLPSVINPAIENGGLAGESKLSYLTHIPPDLAAWVARTQAVPPCTDPHTARLAAGLDFPLIAKPDIGWCGYGVRRIDTASQLDRYALAFPRHATFLLQAFAEGPMEAGLFYARGATQKTGELIGIALRHPPQVTGDGRRSVACLAASDPRANRVPIAPELARQIPNAGEVVVLTTVASLRVGGRYEDGMRLRTPVLQARVDAIARAMAGFNFGRFDVRFTSEAALQAGIFTIIEINGAGSEAIQLWDPSLDLWTAYRGVFSKQKLLFAMAARFRGPANQPVGVIALARAWLAQRSLIRGYPSSN